jgi:hypothetical protein
MASTSISPAKSKARRGNPRSQLSLPSSRYSERTSDRLRAYLASVRPLGDVADIAEGDEYQRGRGLIERMALSMGDAEHDWPSLRLSAAQCADVLRFVSQSEPLEPRAWWADPPDAPSHVCGYEMVLGCVEKSLRGLGGRA